MQEMKFGAKLASAALMLFCLPLVACIHTNEDAFYENANTQVMRVADVEWENLNPARGDQSPKAGTLWGDRNGTGPTGFLLRPVDGFRSPPHIHNVSYRGMVIRGLIHNDDPTAEDMWMPGGSFWTQPKGAVHITAAVGADTLAYIEIESGPYLVHGVAEEFETPERPVNVDVSNLVWLEDSMADGTQVAYLWGDHNGEGLRGTLIKIPEGSGAILRSHGSTFRAVVIQGQPDYGHMREGRVARDLEPGSYVSSEGPSMHAFKAGSGGDCVLYVRNDAQLWTH